MLTPVFKFLVFDDSIHLKFLCIMNKKVLTVIYEILKAVIYALGGFFGGNALM